MRLKRYNFCTIPDNIRIDNQHTKTVEYVLAYATEMGYKCKYLIIFFLLYRWHTHYYYGSKVNSRHIWSLGLVSVSWWKDANPRKILANCCLVCARSTGSMNTSSGEAPLVHTNEVTIQILFLADKVKYRNKQRPSCIFLCSCERVRVYVYVYVRGSQQNTNNKWTPGWRIRI